MAEWGEDFRRFTPDDEDSCTFDLSKINNNFGKKLCVRCKTKAQMSSDQNGLNEFSETVCLTKDCPGYMGHTLTDKMLHSDLTSYDNDESSDDTPLLFDKSPSNQGSTISGAEELDDCHCHMKVPQRNHASKAKKKLMMASAMCLLFIAGEVTGGYLSGSLAIMSDAAHMFSDFASFLVSLFAIHLGSKKSTRRFTYGLYRAEVLGALITVMIIWFVTGVLLFLACHRLTKGDFEVEPNPMIVVASCAVIFNILLGLLLRGVPHSHAHSHGGGGTGHHNLVEEFEDDANNEDTFVAVSNIKNKEKSHDHINLRAATIHVLGDLIQSIGVLISSVIIKINPEYKMADPVCTLLFSVIVFATTVTIIRDTFLILLESKPTGQNYDAIYNDLFNMDYVVKVHDLHIWSLTTDKIILSVHLAVESSVKTELILQNAIKMLRIKHKISQTTIQVEQYKASMMNDCEQCQFLC